MKRIAFVTLAAAIVAAVYAACPGPSYPPCPPNTPTYQYFTWTCCDMDHVCPVFTAQWSRFYMKRGWATSGGDGGICFTDNYIYQYPNEKCQCCGDPQAGPGQATWPCDFTTD